MALHTGARLDVSLKLSRPFETDTQAARHSIRDEVPIPCIAGSALTGVLLISLLPDPHLDAPCVLQEMSPDVLDKYAALAGVGGHTNNFFTKGASKVHDAVLGCAARPLSRRRLQDGVSVMGLFPGDRGQELAVWSYFINTTIVRTAVCCVSLLYCSMVVHRRKGRCMICVQYEEGLMVRLNTRTDV